MSTSLFGQFGKYKGIIVSIALFLLLDASVLLLNFYISFEISDDALDVNLAGRQRMLSQRTMKSLLDTEVSKDSPEQLERALTELENTKDLFNQTLLAFDRGGDTVSANGEPVTLQPAISATATQALNQAKQIWQPYLNHVDTVLTTYHSGNEREFNQQLQQAIVYGQANNLALLKLMNTLTVELERIASSKATRLRWIQTVGITLAVINFFIIMFHFIRQLKDSDEKIDRARKETQEILTTVDEGLLLLDENLVIGEQHSDSLLQLFNRSAFAGQSFEDLIKEMVSEKDLTTAQSFIKLLFKPSVKEKLIGDLNPLNCVEVHIYQSDGSYKDKYLKFAFSRAMQGKQISHVLVTVKDISNEVTLSKQLEDAKSQNNQQIELLYSIAKSNPELLNVFIDNAQKTLEKINLQLKAPGTHRPELIAKANKVFTLMHTLKGDASALELDQLVALAHRFEDEIQAIRDKQDIKGSDFLGLAVLLNRLINQIESMAKLIHHFSEITATDNTPHAPHFDWSHLQKLATNMAEQQNKSVEIIHAGLNDHTLPKPMAETLNSILVQLIRNSVVHGIEPTETRIKNHKLECARIYISVARRADNSYQLTFSDDGRGIDFDKVRLQAVAKGFLQPADADLANKKQLLSIVFHEGFSTSEITNEHAGRGMGMQAVVQQLRALGGKLSVSTRPQQGTRFVLTIPNAVDSAVKAA